LIYIKAGITGEEPPDIHQYSLTHKDFPHETTANQFFNEAQFESYRHLGSFIVDTLVKEGIVALEAPAKCEIPRGPGEEIPASASTVAAAEEVAPDFDWLRRLASLYAKNGGEPYSR
jgi:hypothetical protein